MHKQRNSSPAICGRTSGTGLTERAQTIPETAFGIKRDSSCKGKTGNTEEGDCDWFEVFYHFAVQNFQYELGFSRSNLLDVNEKLSTTRMHSSRMRTAACWLYRGGGLHPGGSASGGLHPGGLHPVGVCPTPGWGGRESASGGVCQPLGGGLHPGSGLSNPRGGLHPRGLPHSRWGESASRGVCQPLGGSTSNSGGGGLNPGRSLPNSRDVCIQGGLHLGGGGWAHTPPVNRVTHRCKNFTLPQTSFAGGNNWHFHTNQ